MNDNITRLLKEYGLSEKEIKVYLTLVEKTELNAYSLAKITGVHRSTTYDILERLISKGFVSKIEKEGKIFHFALEITQTIAKLKSKEAMLSSLIPEFEKIREEGISKVRVFENKDSQKQFNYNLFNLIKRKKIKELYIISGGSLEAASGEKPPEDLSSKIFLETLLKELKKQKIQRRITYKGIWNEKFKGSNLLKLFRGLGEDRFLKKLPTLATIVIFGEYIAYLFTINKKPQVIEIQNRLIAEENKAYFDYLWKQAKS